MRWPCSPVARGRSRSRSRNTRQGGAAGQTAALRPTTPGGRHPHQPVRAGATPLAGADQAGANAPWTAQRAGQPDRRPPTRCWTATSSSWRAGPFTCAAPACGSSAGAQVVTVSDIDGFARRRHGGAGREPRGQQPVSILINRKAAQAQNISSMRSCCRWPRSSNHERPAATPAPATSETAAVVVHRRHRAGLCARSACLALLQQQLDPSRWNAGLRAQALLIATNNAAAVDFQDRQEPRVSCRPCSSSLRCCARARCWPAAWSPLPVARQGSAVAATPSPPLDTQTARMWRQQPGSLPGQPSWQASRRMSNWWPARRICSRCCGARHWRPAARCWPCCSCCSSGRAAGACGAAAEPGTSSWRAWPTAPAWESACQPWRGRVGAAGPQPEPDDRPAAGTRPGAGALPPEPGAADGSTHPRPDRPPPNRAQQASRAKSDFLARMSQRDPTR